MPAQNGPDGELAPSRRRRDSAHVIRLSVCIATFNRGSFIAETLDSIVGQLTPEVELVIVDGGSRDNTQAIIGQYLPAYPQIRYFREATNSGVDQDYDKAVMYASGEYCWLTTDDDIVGDGAIERVLSALMGAAFDLVIVNAQTRVADLSATVEPRRLEIGEDRVYGPDERDAFFSDCANYLSFIGCVVIKRSVWLSRDRASYYGSLFVHVGVIFQHPPIERVKVIADPLIAIRLGNAMWSPRSFEIWTLKWPELVWSFQSFSDRAKQRVCDREPWRRLNSLLYNRAIGAFSPEQYRKCLMSRGTARSRLPAYVIGKVPGSVANWLSVGYLLIRKRKRPLAFFTLLSSPHARMATRLLVRAFGGGAAVAS
jgi:abequosyltransferase